MGHKESKVEISRVVSMYDVNLVSEGDAELHPYIIVICTLEPLCA